MKRKKRINNRENLKNTLFMIKKILNRKYLKKLLS